ncbi:hypothetical protein THAOC_25692 [Thalassiosira oceanica]|uniref:Uncharacterized protein n=1 Tax=Thalassiosira oceanica TaxID=159749 RepID=K0S0T7_THAOC|nr:hypothetical protein THAOC_25692 [Thalassiosira oceanica]|eukprot:EJK54661.1 hypothetical protein THAOC_25692 [Thalassiosira oceanica]
MKERGGPCGQFHQRAGGTNGGHLPGAGRLGRACSGGVRRGRVHGGDHAPLQHAVETDRAADYAFTVHTNLFATGGAGPVRVNRLETAEVPLPQRAPNVPGLEWKDLDGWANTVRVRAHDPRAVSARGLVGEARGGNVLHGPWHAGYGVAEAGRGPVDDIAHVSDIGAHVVDNWGREGDRERSKLHNVVVLVADHEHFVDLQVVTREAVLNEVVHHGTELKVGWFLHVQGRLEPGVVIHVDNGGYSVAHVVKFAVRFGGAGLVRAAAILEGAGLVAVSPAPVDGRLDGVGADGAVNGVKRPVQQLRISAGRAGARSFLVVALRALGGRVLREVRLAALSEARARGVIEAFVDALGMPVGVRDEAPTRTISSRRGGWTKREERGGIWPV